MAFPTYSSVIAQTIRTVQHLDGAERVYTFSAGVGSLNYGTGNYGDNYYGGVSSGTGVTPTTQAEKWELDELAVEYGLVVV